MFCNVNSNERGGNNRREKRNEGEDFSDQFWSKNRNSAQNEGNAPASFVINFFFFFLWRHAKCDFSRWAFRSRKRISTRAARVLLARASLITEIKSHYLQSSYACKWNPRRARVAKGGLLSYLFVCLRMITIRKYSAMVLVIRAIRAISCRRKKVTAGFSDWVWSRFIMFFHYIA